MQAAVLLSSAVFIALNLAVDLCYGYLDPGSAIRDPATVDGFRVATCLCSLAVLTLGTISVWALLPWRLAPHMPDEQEIAVRLTPPRWSEGGSACASPGYGSTGRDVFSRVIYGARVSVIVALSALAISGTIGITIGLLAGYYGGRVDDWIMRVADIQLSIPYVLLAIAVIAVIGASTRNVVLVLAMYGWVAYARLVRGQTLSLREREFVHAYRAMGASDWRIISRHILPNVFSAVIVVARWNWPASSCSSHRCRSWALAFSRRQSAGVSCSPTGARTFLAVPGGWSRFPGWRSPSRS